MMKRILFFLSFAALCPAIHAQSSKPMKAKSERTVTVVTTVRNALTNKEITARVSLLRADSTLVDTLTYEPLVHEYYRLIPLKAGHYIVKAEAEEFETEWAAVNLPRWVYDDRFPLPTMCLLPTPKANLKEVTVTATKVKFFHRGDTLIYDATAFDIPGGSMLDELIRQLPGVELKEDGSIFVEGKRIDELTLGGRSFFGGRNELLLKNLPVYTVKRLKVYDKQSDRSHYLGYNAGGEKKVMDVVLKKEYERGVIANMEAAGGTHDRWLARAFLLGYVGSWRFSVAGNANNVSVADALGKSGLWWPSFDAQTPSTTHGANAELDWKDGKQVVSETLTASWTKNMTKPHSRTQQETFLPTGTMRSMSEEQSESGSRSIALKNVFSTQRPFYLPVTASLSHSKADALTSNWFEQHGDSLLAATVANGESRSRSDKWGVSTKPTIKLPWRRDHIDLQFSYDYARRTGESFNRSRTDYTSAGTPDDYRRTYGETSNTTRSLGGNASYSFSLPHAWRVNTAYSVKHSNEQSHDRLFRLERLADWGMPDSLNALTDLPSNIDALQSVIDLDNSMDYHRRTTEQTYDLSLTQRRTYPNGRGTKQQVELHLPVVVLADRIDYTRSGRDLSVDERITFFNPSLTYDYGFDTKRFDSGMSLGAWLKQGSAGLMNRMDYRDDRNPLLVRLGNPGLKPNSTTGATAGYNFFADHFRGDAEASFTYQLRSVANAMTFNPVTGARTYQPQNIDGGWDANLNIFGHHWRDGKKTGYSIEAQTSLNLNHSVDFASENTEMTLDRVAVNNIFLTQTATCEFSVKGVKFNIPVSVMWRHTSAREGVTQAINAIETNLGANVYYTIPGIKTYLNLNMQLRSRRGYNDPQLNTDDFITNASISQPIFKGKLIARLEAFDIFQQIKSTSYAVNAQGRTVTWHNSLPSYVMAHVVYHWNKNPKKK